MSEVLIICKYAAAPNQGTLTRLYYVGKYIAKSGRKVKLLKSSNNHLSGGGSSNSYFLQDGLEVEDLPGMDYGNGKSFRRIMSWFYFELKVILYALKARNKYSYVIVSSPSIFSVISGFLLSKFSKAKFIFDVRDIWPLVLVEEGGYKESGIAIKFLRLLERYGVLKSDLTISSIPNISQYYDESFPEKKSAHMFFPMCLDEDLTLSKPNTDYVTELDHERIVVGYAGSVGYGNNLELLVKFIKDSEVSSKFVFKILGRGPFLEEAKADLAGLDNVFFYPETSRGNVHNFLRTVDVGFISSHDSSLWRYGQSLNKLLDYMNNGLPVLFCYPSYGYRTLIEDGVNGFYCEPNSSSLSASLERLSISSKQELCDMGARAAEEVKKNWAYSQRYPQLVTQMFLYLEANDA